MAPNPKANIGRREIIALGAAAAAVVATSPGTVHAAVDSNEAQQNTLQTWRIIRYSFGWNAAKRSGIVRLFLERAANPIDINVATPEEFSGYVSLLKESPLFYRSDGWIYSGNQTVW